MTIGFFETRLERKKSKRLGDARRRVRSAAEIDYAVYQQRGCDGCPLWSEQLNSPRMRPTGERHPDIYILGEAPGADEDRNGEQFVGRTGRPLRDVLAAAGLKSICWDNCCRCRPPNNRTPERVAWECCRNRVVRSLERAKPKVLVAVGGVALQWAIGEPGIIKWRGKFIPVKIGNHTCWLYPIPHPSFVLRSREEDDWRLVLECDLRGLASRLTAGLLEPAPEPLENLERGVHYATDTQGLGRLARQLAVWSDAKAVVAFDVETACLRPYQYLPASDGWLSIAFSDGKITWAMPASHREAGWTSDDYLRMKRLVVGFLRSRCIKVAHNLPFELEWLTSVYGHKPPWRRTGWGDTMSQAYVLDERRGGLSLDDCCLHRFGFRLKDQSNVDRSRLADLDRDRLLKYNALDAKYTARLYYVQREEIERAGLQDVCKMHLRRCLTLVKAQQKGLVVDFPLVVKYQARVQKKIDRCLREVVGSKEALRYEKEVGKSLSPMSVAQVAVLFRDILQRPEGARTKNKSGYSVDDSALVKMGLPVADAILKLRVLCKLKSTYLDPCVPVGGLAYADGRLHTKFNDLFTVTGRLSSDTPNMQNFPKREDAWIRAIITTPKGDGEHVLVSVDYGQIEPRVIAMASGDERLCKAVRERRDIHGDWAKRIAKECPKALREHDGDMKVLRQEVKSNWVLAGFYGKPYDSIAATLCLGERCCGLFDAFKEEFAGVWEWQRRQLKLYKKQGYVVGLSGRRRRAPLSVNQVLNNPTQGAASDIVVEAMNRLSVRAEKEGEPAFQAVLNIHDDLTFYVPEDRRDKLVREIVREMLMPAFDWVTVPLQVDVTVGPNWADMKEAGTYFSDDLGGMNDV